MRKAQLMDAVLTPDGIGKVAGYDDEHYVLVVLDAEHEANYFGVFQQARRWYRPDEINVIK